MVATYWLFIGSDYTVFEPRGYYETFIKVSNARNRTVWVHTKSVSGHRFFIWLQFFDLQTLEELKLPWEKYMFYEFKYMYAVILKTQRASIIWNFVILAP